MKHIYIGTGGYSDTDLLGTLYPHGTKNSDFLYHYAQYYDCVEINSTFHTPIGQKALLGMLDKAAGRLKLHQDFSHQRTVTAQYAYAFFQLIQLLGEHLAHLFVQFPHSFERTPANRRYLGELCAWFEGYPLVLEFRSPTWHVEPVFAHFQAAKSLIWCNLDYPVNIGLPNTAFWTNARNAYLRLHGRNPNWWQAESACQRHDYRYNDAELKELADTIFRQCDDFDALFIYFQNTTQSHSFYNIPVLKGYLAELGFAVKTPNIEPERQGSLF
ncbi:DUF72 domain-containing protein [Wielerella bovis]|uniref:DUF72 domain-containing protein n=1 Tax=Wielerella bovis TaxID=2917790 RepID=UPI002019DB0C|nr:DUF72 domain-containing protein [Wielerella bovis]ULJ68746.1 DUF72 domain-containing protein [Wielerella bovis]